MTTKNPPLKAAVKKTAKKTTKTAAKTKPKGKTKTEIPVETDEGGTKVRREEREHSEFEEIRGRHR